MGVLGDVGSIRLLPEDGSEGCERWNQQKMGPVKHLGQVFIDCICFRVQTNSYLQHFPVNGGKIVFTGREESALETEIVYNVRRQLKSEFCLVVNYLKRLAWHTEVDRQWIDFFV